LQAVDEQNHFASTVQVTFVFSTCPSSAFGEAHVPLLPSALDLQPLQNKPKVLDAWISLKIGAISLHFNSPLTKLLAECTLNVQRVFDLQIFALSGGREDGMLAPGATALMGMASPFTVLLAAVLGKEGRQPKLQCPTHTHTLKINMLQCLKYLAEAICRALRGRRGEELLKSAGVADAGRRRAGQRRWRARAGGMRQCGPSDGCWFRSPPCMPLSSPAAALPRRLCPPRCM